MEENWKIEEERSRFLKKVGHGFEKEEGRKLKDKSSFWLLTFEFWFQMNTELIKCLKYSFSLI